MRIQLNGPLKSFAREPIPWREVKNNCHAIETKLLGFVARLVSWYFSIVVVHVNERATPRVLEVVGSHPAAFFSVALMQHIVSHQMSYSKCQQHFCIRETKVMS